MLPIDCFPAELVAQAVAEDEREWVPSAFPGVWMRPLLFDVAHGAWVNVYACAPKAWSVVITTLPRFTAM